MRKKQLIVALAAIILMPLAAAKADTNATTGADCGSAPTRPTVASGSTAPTQAQFQTFMQAMKTYRTCMGITGTGSGGHGFGLGKGMGVANGQGEVNNQANKQDRCTAINQRLTNRVSVFQNNQNNDKTIFGNLYDRLSNIQVRLKNAGLDTGTLTSDLSTLQTDINKVNTDYASFISNLQSVQSSSATCGNSNGQFMTNLKSARTILTTVRTDRQMVRSYVTGTIVPEITTLRQQLQSKNGSSASSPSTTSN